MKLLIALFIAGLCITHASAQTLRSGDSLSITVLQDPKLDRTVLVDPKGEIALPLAGHIRARGLTPEAVENILRARLKDNYKDGRVDVTVALAGNAPKEAPEDDLKPRVFLTGEVAKPGRYPYTSNMRIEDLIHTAGGLKRSADTTVADLTRYSMNGKPGEHLEVSLPSVMNGNSTEDVALRMGDVLAIRQAPGCESKHVNGR